MKGRLHEGSRFGRATPTNRWNTGARAQSARVSNEALTVDLVDGCTIVVPLIWYPRLWHGTPRERNRFEIFGDGTYIHWPALDEDLTVAGLLAGRQSGARALNL